MRLYTEVLETPVGELYLVLTENGPKPVLEVMRDSELDMFLYFLINIGLLLVGTLLSRRVFAVFAALGMLGYLGYLSWEIFEDSLMFPVVVAFVGIGIIFAGVQWQRHEERLNAAILGVLPGPLRDLVARAHQ